MLKLDVRWPRNVCHDFVAQTVTGITESLDRDDQRGCDRNRDTTVPTTVTIGCADMVTCSQKRALEDLGGHQCEFRAVNSCRWPRLPPRCPPLHVLRTRKHSRRGR
jgi:hypothetical protein